MDPTEATELIGRLDAASSRHITFSDSHSRMVWRRWGDGDPLVLLHGGAGCWMHWVRNIEDLSRSWTVWAPDMPGFGDSDLPREGLDADSIAPMVLRGAEELLAGERMSLAGFSFGSLVAGHMAASAPDAVKSLVLVGATGLGLMDRAPELRRHRGVTDPEERAAIFRSNLAELMLHDENRIDALALALHERCVTRERVKGRRLARTDVLLQLAPAWRCPVFGLWGSQDFAYRHQLDRLRATFPRLRLREGRLLEGVGHWAAYEAPVAFNQAMRDFMSG